MPPPETLWTADDVAAYMKVTRRYVWELARNGKLPMKRLPDGRGMRFDERAIKLHLAAKAAR